MLACSRESRKKFTYNARLIENINNFKYSRIEIPSTHKWSNSMARCLAIAKRMYYMLENICNQKDIHRWKVKIVPFEAYVMQTMLYGIKVWGGSISSSMWDDIRKIQKSFIRKYIDVRVTTSYSLLLTKSGCVPIKCYGLGCTLRYIQNVSNKPQDRLP